MSTYLPMPLNAAHHIWNNFSNRHALEDTKDKDGKWIRTEKSDYNKAVDVLLNTAVAITGYLAINRFHLKWDGPFLPMSAMIAMIVPYALWIEATTFYTVQGAIGAVAAVKERNVYQLAKNLAIAALAYAGTTTSPGWVMNKINKFFMI